MLIKNCKNIIQVGDKVKINGNGRHAQKSWVKGIIGEIDETNKRFFIWHNNSRFEGGKGNFNPESKGFKYSWVIDFDNEEGEILINKPKKKGKTIKKKMIFNLKKEGKDTFIYLKIPEELENFYKNLSKGETSKSGFWLLENGEGAEFYNLNQEYEKEEKKNIGYVFNNYGSGLFDGEKINLAFLRTLGASKGIKIKSEKFEAISGMELEFYIRELGNFTKRIWEHFINKKEVRAVISFEI